LRNWLTRNMDSRSVLDLYNLLLAAVLFGSPWFFAHASRAAELDLRLSAAAIIILSLAAMIAFSAWEEWLNLALGLWLAISPWLLGFTHTPAMHFAIGIGLAIAFLASLELWLRFDVAGGEAASSVATQKR
jgi:SPW repeat-containing protein